MVLKADTRAEHRLWVQGIAYLCPNAQYNGECMIMIILGIYLNAYYFM